MDETKFLRSVQNCVRSYRRTALHDNDYIDEMVALASKHRYRESLDDTTSFAFGFDYDEKNEPILGRVDGNDPLVVGFATKPSLRRLADAKTLFCMSTQLSS